MRKNLLLLILFVFSFSAIHADDIKWEISEDGTLTISGTDMPAYPNSSAPWLENQYKIKKVVIKDGVTNISWGAFEACGSLTSVEIPNSVTYIGYDAFAWCYNLTSIEIPNSVMDIDNEAFKYCEKLTSITIPKSVTILGNNVFGGCFGLTSITVEKGNTKYDSRDNCNAIIETNSNKLITGCKNTVIPNSVTSIGYKAFMDIKNLTSITIPNSVTSIEDYAFDNCKNITSITIPNSVTSIGDLAFSYCKGLTSITFKGSTPPNFEYDVFRGVDNSIPVYVPANSIEAYKSAMEGLGVSNIQANPKQVFLKNSDPYTQKTQIDGAEVSFTRNFTGYWEALYLPFSLKYEDWKDDFEVARINAVRQYDDDNDGDIDRTVFEFVKMKSGNIKPNTPYLIKAKEKGEKTLFVENTTVYKAEKKSVECSTTTEKFIFTGLYEKMSLLQKASGKYYVMDKGNLSKITTLSDIGPYRWYMTREDRNSAYGIKNNNMSKEISIRVIGEETTGVSELRMTNDELPVYELPVYDLNGRKVNENNLKPGIYVKNGKKFIVK